jgi:peptidyl-prolyl cis-trans isomerase SurA
MTSSPSSWLALAALLCVIGGNSATAQNRTLSDKGVMLDRVAAVVNDGVVLRSELEEQMSLVGERLKAQGLEMPPADVLRQQVLERCKFSARSVPAFASTTKT